MQCVIMEALRQWVAQSIRPIDTGSVFVFCPRLSISYKELRWFRQCSLYHSVCFQWDQCVSELSVPPSIDGFRCPQSKNITCSGHLVTISNQLLVKPSPGAPSFQTNLKPRSTTLSEKKKNNVDTAPYDLPPKQMLQCQNTRQSVALQFD